jgi:hypothetical protein
MSNHVEVVVLVEGHTEQLFINKLLAKYMGERSVSMRPIILNKPGQKGGDVKFARAKNDIETHLKQRSNTWVTLMVDYYGIHSDWPGYNESKHERLHSCKAEIMNQATAQSIIELFANYNPKQRFIPYVSMHELEALYFSDPVLLADKLGIRQRKIDTILIECGEPEKINDNIQTSPSKRLETLFRGFKKTVTGLDIAQKIGIERMRQACPIFNGWLTQLENLAK